MNTHMRHTSGANPPTALCNTTITTGLTPDPAHVTCPPCRTETGRIIAEQENERAQAAAESDD